MIRASVWIALRPLLLTACGEDATASHSFQPGTLEGTPPQGNDAKCGFACHTNREIERLRLHGLRGALNGERVSRRRVWIL
jgi:hypothetical protein